MTSPPPASEAFDRLDRWLASGAAGNPPPGVDPGEAEVARALFGAAGAITPDPVFAEALAGKLAAADLGVTEPPRSSDTHPRAPASRPSGAGGRFGPLVDRLSQLDTRAKAFAAGAILVTLALALTWPAREPARRPDQEAVTPVTAEASGSVAATPSPATLAPGGARDQEGATPVPTASRRAAPESPRSPAGATVGFPTGTATPSPSPSASPTATRPRPPSGTPTRPPTATRPPTPVPTPSRTATERADTPTPSKTPYERMPTPSHTPHEPPGTPTPGEPSRTPTRFEPSRTPTDGPEPTRTPADGPTRTPADEPTRTPEATASPSGAMSAEGAVATSAEGAFAKQDHRLARLPGSQRACWAQPRARVAAATAIQPPGDRERKSAITRPWSNASAPEGESSGTHSTSPSTDERAAPPTTRPA